MATKTAKKQKREPVFDRAIDAGASGLWWLVSSGWGLIPTPVQVGMVLGLALVAVVGFWDRLWALGLPLAVLAAVGVPVGWYVGLPRIPAVRALLRRSSAPTQAGDPSAERICAEWETLTAPGTPLAGTLGGSGAEPWGKDDVSWSIRIRLLAGRTADQLMNQTAQLESLIDARRGSVLVLPDEAARKVTVRVLKRDMLASSPAWEPPAPRSIFKPIRLGVFADGKEAAVSLLPAAGAARSLALSGQPGMGKSNVLHGLVAALAACEDVVLAGIDSNGVGLGLWTSCFDPDLLALEDTQIRDVLERVLERMKSRNRLMRREAAQVWNPTSEFPALVLVIDEGAVLAEQKVMPLLDQVVSQGRKDGVHVVFASQRLSSQALGGGIGKETISKFRSKIALPLGDRVECDVALGLGAGAAGWRPDQLLHRPGELLLKDDDHWQVMPGRSMRIEDDDVKSWAKRCAVNRPRLE